MGSIIVPGCHNGIDISSANTLYSPQALVDAGFEFVYLQSSRYSSTVEGVFHKRVDLLRKVGLKVGAYHFCSHDSDPEKQAEFFFRASGGLGSKKGELPPMIDWEFCTPTKYPNHQQHCVRWLERMAQRVEDLWYPSNRELGFRFRYPTIYTYPNYSNVHQPVLKGSTVGLWPLTYASYKSGPDGKEVPWVPNGLADVPCHPIPLPWKTTVLVQYSGNGGLPVPGLAGKTDRLLFTGNEVEWDVWLNGHTVN